MLNYFHFPSRKPQHSIVSLLQCWYNMIVMGNTVVRNRMLLLKNNWMILLQFLFETCCLWVNLCFTAGYLLFLLFVWMMKENSPWIQQLLSKDKGLLTASME